MFFQADIHNANPTVGNAAEHTWPVTELLLHWNQYENQASYLSQHTSSEVVTGQAAEPVNDGKGVCGLVAPGVVICRSPEDAFRGHGSPQVLALHRQGSVNHLVEPVTLKEPATLECPRAVSD